MKYPVVHGVPRPDGRIGVQYTREYEFEGLAGPDDALMVPLDGREPDAVRTVIYSAHRRARRYRPERFDFDIETHWLRERDVIGVWRVFPSAPSTPLRGRAGVTELPGLKTDTAAAEPPLFTITGGHTVIDASKISPLAHPGIPITERSRSDRGQKTTAPEQYHVHCGRLIKHWLRRKLNPKVLYASTLGIYLTVSTEQITNWMDDREPIPDSKLQHIARLLNPEGTFEVFMAADT